MANADVASPSLFSSLCETLMVAYRRPALTERSAEVAQYCQQVLDVVASGRFDASNLKSGSHREFERLVKLESRPERRALID